MKAIAIFSGMLILCGLAFGQTTTTPPTPPNPPSPTQVAADRVAYLTQALSLTSQQQDEATQILKTETTTLEGLHPNIAAAHTALQTAIEGKDTDGISAAATQIGQLTTQEVEAHATADLQLRAILSADQLTKFKTLRAHHPHGFGPGGPGGPGGPPPPPGA